MELIDLTAQTTKGGQTAPQTVKAFEPVTYYNAVNPNEWVYVRDPANDDPAEDKVIKFLQGIYVAQTPEESKVIETYLKGRAHKKNTEDPLVCDDCQWVCYSTTAYQHHIRQHP